MAHNTPLLTKEKGDINIPAVDIRVNKIFINLARNEK